MAREEGLSAKQPADCHHSCALRRFGLISKHWRIANTISPEDLRALGALDPLLAKVLWNRGVRTSREAETFLSRDGISTNPFLLPDMTEAVTRIRRAIRSGELIVIYGDYDADGVTATALLTSTLRAMGATAHPYIPHRVDEGYGLNKSALHNLRKHGAQVVVTVDCGIRSVAEVKYARQLGMDVIITDHHGIGDTLPEATAAINPRRQGARYEFQDLAGVGVAYRLAQALLRVEGKVPAGQAGAELHEEDLLDLVAIGTVADVVPLLGENRALVHSGLERIREGKRAGVSALLAEAGVKPDRVDAQTIGFIIGPRINAAGRMASARKSLELLVTPSVETAAKIAESLGKQNRERQELTARLLEEARGQVRSEPAGAPILLVSGPQYKAGVAGLVAGQLTREYYRPSVVLEVGDSESKASARSIPEFHITSALDQCADLLVRHGGHAEAAGFTVRNENWPGLAERLASIAQEQLGGRRLMPTLEIDAELSLSLATLDTLEILDRLRPFGHANAAPLFVARGAQVRSARTVGRGHLQLALAEGERAVRAIAFRQAEWASHLPGRVDVAFHLQLDDWRGGSDVQLLVEDIRPADASIDTSEPRQLGRNPDVQSRV